MNGAETLIELNIPSMNESSKVRTGLVLQLRKECELMQQRAETAEAAVQKEGGLHRRELRRRAKELADMQEDLVQVCKVLRCLHSRA